MKILQNNNFKIDWPLVATLTEDAYLCTKTNNEMSDETQLNELHDEEMTLKPYTMEEINAMIDEAECESAADLGQDSEEMFRELEEEFSVEKHEQPELAQSYESEVVAAS